MRKTSGMHMSRGRLYIISESDDPKDDSLSLSLEVEQHESEPLILRILKLDKSVKPNRSLQGMERLRFMVMEVLFVCRRL